MDKEQDLARTVRIPREHVVQLSGGVGSWMTARRVIERYGRDHVTLLFADVLIEDEDLYRFLEDVEEDLQVPVTRIAEGRDPWQVFKDKRYIGNSRVDPCSEILKRKFLWKYMDEHYDPRDTYVYLGIDWTEEHRFLRAKERALPWVLRAPLCEPPHIDKGAMLEELRRAGIKIPRLYEMGFPHNNCGGFCIKAGQGQFKLLLEKMPERYRHHERKEQEMREFLGKDVSILRAQRDGVRSPLTLRQLRLRVQSGTDNTDPFDLGGCGCAVD